MPDDSSETTHPHNDDTTAVGLIRQLDALAAQGAVTPESLDDVWVKAGMLPQSVSREDTARHYELRAIILALRGSVDEAASYLTWAKNRLPKGGSFVSPHSVTFLGSYQSKKKKQLWRRLAISISAAAIIVLPLVALFQWMNSDEMVIANADPQMAQLADRAGMTPMAKAIFLRADPKLLPKEQLAQECANNNAAGGEVDGCYDPLLGNIFIRDMPERFDDYEAVIAAHEMLHAAFNSGQAESAASQLEAELATGHADIQQELRGYALFDREGRLDEIHSHLGTQAADIQSQQLENYFSQYFTSRDDVAKKYNDTLAFFKTKETELSQQSDEITATQNQARAYYRSHQAAAARGDQASADRYYMLYTESYESAEGQIAAYNKATDEYNALVDSFSGKPLETIAPSQFN